MKAAVVTNKGILLVIKEIQEPTVLSDDALMLNVKASALTIVSKGVSLGNHYSSDDAFSKVAGMEGVGESDSGERYYFLMGQKEYMVH
ncbi:hypothetical protein [Weissella hellenica]|uniref:Uncharacterized protein n=1 Tax=Weissella hellenica TaxID=46256 RepID=A0A4Y4G7Y3_WEIHE|nr:hypothetical protein [Weissella hellenica]NKY67238.1 hypothetical protein [Weissella hellenica]GED36151.1 hypothetical protein WHE01_10550 [Weissella hellenica]SCC00228.1 hypothetical protein GA0061075_11034 [Weissella hellenica]